MKTRWFVVCDEYATEPRKRDRIWTVSRNPKQTGWETDCGNDRYGLTWREAKELADAANAAWESK